MILFIGNPEKQFYVDEAAGPLGMEVKGTGKDVYHASEITEAARTCPEADTIVVNIEMLTDPLREQSAVLESLRAATNASIILMDIGESENSMKVQYFRQRGFTRFIHSSDLSLAHEQTTAALHHESTVKAPKPDDIDLSNTEFRYLSFAGTCRRIGTTTQAIQSALFLQRFYKQVNSGKRVAVVEKNTTGFVTTMAAETNQDDAPYYRYRGVDFFPATAEAGQLESYGTVLFDCGYVGDPDFPRYLFNQSDRQIVVFGDKFGEGERFAFSYGADVVSYVGTFIPEYRKNDILDQFGKKRAERVFFAPYQPSAFDFDASTQELYASLLSRQHRRRFRR